METWGRIGMAQTLPERFAVYVATEEATLLGDLARALTTPLGIRHPQGRIILATADLKGATYHAPIWIAHDQTKILLGSLEAGPGGDWTPATIDSLASELSRRFQGRVDCEEQRGELDRLRAECHLLRRLTYLHVRDADTLTAVNAAMEEIALRLPERVLLFWEAAPERVTWSGWRGDHAAVAEWLMADPVAPQRIHGHLRPGGLHAGQVACPRCRLYYAAAPVGAIGWVGLFRTADEVPLTSAHTRMLECLAAELSNLIAREQQRHAYREMLYNTVRSLTAAIEAKDPSARGHSERVYRLAILIAKRLHLPAEAMPTLSWAAWLHDIGKLAISSALLCDPEALSPEDFEIIKTHPERGCQVLAPILQLRGTLPAIRHHHERFDGTGYPDGLVGDEIPVEARIIAVADSYEALRSSRAYRQAVKPQEALAMIRAGAGTRFDPLVAEACLELARAGRLERFEDLAGPAALDLPAWSPAEEEAA